MVYLSTSYIDIFIVIVIVFLYKTIFETKPNLQKSKPKAIFIYKILL